MALLHLLAIKSPDPVVTFQVTHARTQLKVQQPLLSSHQHFPAQPLLLQRLLLRRLSTIPCPGLRESQFHSYSPWLFFCWLTPLSSCSTLLCCMSKQHILIFPSVSFQQAEKPMVSWSDIVCISTRLLSHHIFASLINLSSDIFSNQIFLSIFKQDSGHFPSLSPCLLEANDMPFRLIRLKQWTNKTSSFSCRAIAKNESVI